MCICLTRSLSTGLFLSDELGIEGEGSSYVRVTTACRVNNFLAPTRGSTIVTQIPDLVYLIPSIW